MSTLEAPPGLPRGFAVRIRPEVSRHSRKGRAGVVLVGGSPVRAITLSAAAAAFLRHDTLTVTTDATAMIARRLLDANVADPLPAPSGTSPEALTVVVPVRDRPVQLARCLDALRGLAVVVVDDASEDPAAVAAVAHRAGARLVALELNGGPAAARNAGLATVTTPFVAFVDSDVVIGAERLLALVPHLDDPLVALVGPRIRGRARSGQPRWFEAYDAAASSLSLGDRACSVAPGAAVGWLPSACLVARSEALGGEIAGFDADMRVGEDVDLVWRLVASGWRVRYDPTVQADHDARPTLSAGLGRRFLYGTGGAPLAERHGSAVAVARLSPLMAAAGAGVLLRRPWSVALASVATVAAARSVHRTLPDSDDRLRLASTLALRGLGWSVRQESALALRHWWPAAAAACLVSRSARRVVASALIVDTVVALRLEAPAPDAQGRRPGLVARLAGRRLDDLAYGAGLWVGALRSRDLGCLAVETTGRKR
jgi:mycofactocin glycosyltransferase